MFFKTIPIILILFLFHPSSALAATCQRNTPVSIEVVNDIQPTEYDFTQNTRMLDRIGRGAYSPYGEGHKTYLRGLTVGRQSLTYEIRIEEQKTHADMMCLYVGRIKVLMRYNPTVYVSNEFPEGSPIFYRVLAHEQTHVGITTDVLRHYAPILRERLKAAPIGNDIFGPYFQGEREIAKAELHEGVKATVSALHQEMQLESQRRHNRYDDEELQEGLSYNRDVAKRLEDIFKIHN
ncbi:MAG: hypothetical protein GW903_00860 [Alphaproteobacteria bacterium]|nr:hypothetical protein [Alphaproteobacteria bacterium]NCQ87520.1 hypothetical protein [Alphaproteobacteria bacterium]NCT06388.1 hypothetical protein [Alphaproteobacteria bacterium]